MWEIPMVFPPEKNGTCFSSEVNRLMELLHDLEERRAQPSSSQAKDEEKERLKVHSGRFVSGRRFSGKLKIYLGKGEN